MAKQDRVERETHEELTDEERAAVVRRVNEGHERDVERYRMRMERSATWLHEQAVRGTAS